MKSSYRKPLICTIILLIMIGILSLLEGNTAFVEHYFSRSWYPLFSYLPQFVLGYLPFSFGDLFYAGIIVYLLVLFISIFKYLLKKTYTKSIQSAIYLINMILGLYLFFYISWGMNYYRSPIAQNTDLSTDSLKLADYLILLEKSLDSTNYLRSQVNPKDWVAKSEKIKDDMERLVITDTTFQYFLSTTLIHAKGPLNSSWVSYFGVSGYFNPFTHEAHVNQAMPVFSSPFTYVHELAHQQGIGFEDEANFIAYVRLKNHPETFYRYSNYLQTTSYLLRELRGIDKDLFLTYKDRLSSAVLSDLKEEAEFWSTYTGWINKVSDLFYNGYLKHNNQSEGLARYDRMTRLVLAYELKQHGCLVKPKTTK
ncbi:DUF3810 domain-containing protein [Sphingobacterium sp. SRCM116780]|uniref:DUF3810 domain-containing protein n=1 Tax=Sphingobacterium sp. SRCM116780 TaxID=2907623 RepID=UPI001F44ECCE|nr:DUF3810 domain-containing protein [Sphingobacterium sp. SRCM116780]UIR57193.1 DUF3810 domain-containing protein [Sphingobacterium sp. SRCM116780]